MIAMDFVLKRAGGGKVVEWEASASHRNEYVTERLAVEETLKEAPHRDGLLPHAGTVYIHGDREVLLDAPGHADNLIIEPYE